MERKGKIVSISISDARDRVGATTGAADPRESRTCSRSHRREEGRERKKQLVAWTRSFEEGPVLLVVLSGDRKVPRRNETAPRDSAVVFLYHVNLMRDRNGAQGLEVSRTGTILSIYRAVLMATPISTRLLSSVTGFSGRH